MSTRSTLDTRLVKRGHAKNPYDLYKLKELKQCIQDPIYFTKNYVKIQHPVKGQTSFELYPYQEELLSLYKNYRFCIALLSRQSGKTTCAASFLLWKAMFTADCTILVASHQYSGASEIMQRIRYAYEELPDFIRAGVMEYNKGSIAFDNGSRIISQATTEKTGRGLSLTLIYCDEFAFVEPRIAQEFWTSLSPTLSCVVGDTMVLTDGGYRRIEDFHKNKQIGDYFPIQNVNVWGMNGLELVSHGYVSPESDTFIIKTRHGLKLEVTHNHPLYKLCSSGGVMTPAKNLKIGDYLRVDMNMNIFGSNDINEEFAYMLGGYTAEGWMGFQLDKNKNRKYFSIYISNIDDQFRQKYVDNRLGKKFIVCKRKTETHKLMCHSVDMVNKFIDAGINPEHRCFQKTIPYKIFGSSKKVIAAYLRGLFDGDGSITHRSINLTSTSEQLVNEVQLLLNNFGIVSSIYKNNVEKIWKREIDSHRILPHGKTLQSLRTSWSLNIPLSQYEKFYNEIGIGLDRKRNKLFEIIQKRKQEDFKHFYIPADIIKDRIFDILYRTEKTKAWFRTRGLRFDKCFDGKVERFVTQRWMRLFYNIIIENSLPVSDDDILYIEQFIQNDHYWDDIVSITLSTNKTYDFTVPKTHSFLQNGIIGSNTGGSCIITSTPNSETDQFAEIWREANIITDEYGNIKPDGIGRNQFKAYSVSWKEVPRDEDNDEFERKMRAQLGDDRWDREFGCEFISFEETLIAPHILKNIKGIQPIEQRGRVRWYSEILPNKVYIVGLDPSMGTGGDDAAITVWQLPEMLQVAEWKHNKTDTKEQVRILLDILIDIHKKMKSYSEQKGKPEIYWSVENNSLGEAVLKIIDATGEDKFPGDFVHEPRKKRKGFTTTNKNKIEACVRLKNLIESRKMIITSVSLVEELKSFVRSNRSYAAKMGQSDNIIMSTILCIRILNELQNWDDDIYQNLADIINLDDEEDAPMPLLFG